LLWDDHRAPEPVVDVELPNFANWKSFALFFGVLAALAGVYKYVESTDPNSRRPNPLTNEYRYPWDVNSETMEELEASMEKVNQLYEDLNNEED